MHSLGSMQTSALGVLARPMGGSRTLSLARPGRLLRAAPSDGIASSVIQAGLKGLNAELSFNDLKSLAKLAGKNGELLLEEGAANDSKKIMQLDPLPQHVDTLAYELGMSSSHVQMDELYIFARGSFLPRISTECSGAAYQVDVFFSNTSDCKAYVIEGEHWVGSRPGVWDSRAVDDPPPITTVVRSEQLWTTLKPGDELKKTLTLVAYGAARGSWVLQGSISVGEEEKEEEEDAGGDSKIAKIEVALKYPRWFCTEEEAAWYMTMADEYMYE